MRRDFLAFIVPLTTLQLLVVGFLGMQKTKQFVLSQEPVFLELRGGLPPSAGQELLVFLQNFSSVRHVAYRTREQQFLAMQSMVPDVHFSEGDTVLFQDALLVHVRTLEGYRSLLGALMVEPAWQKALSPRTLNRLGEQVQAVHSLKGLLLFFQGSFLVVALLLSCVLFFSLLRHACHALGAREGNGILQEYLGARPFSIVWPVAYRLSTTLFFGVLLSLALTLLVVLMMHDRGPLFSQILLPLLYQRGWSLLFSEGIIAALFSLGGVLCWKYAACLHLRCDRSPCS